MLQVHDISHAKTVVCADTPKNIPAVAIKGALEVLEILRYFYVRVKYYFEQILKEKTDRIPAVSVGRTSALVAGNLHQPLLTSSANSV